MNRKSKHPQSETIRSWAWQCTIGAGRVGDDFPDQLDEDMVALLVALLKRDLTHEDHEEMHRAWRQCEMESAFP